MKLLVVVRHAKASWPNALCNDYERPLKQTGIQDAKQISQYLNLKKYIPDYIISSAATRTIETANIFSKELTNLKLAPKKDALMYGASPKQLLELISQINDDYNAVMVVGHNPTITSLINIVSDASIDHIPTSGTSVIKFNVPSWKNLVNTEGTLIEFIYPKKLKLL